MHTRRRPSGDEGRGGVMRLQAKECRRRPAKHRKLGKREGAGHLAASEGAGAADTLTPAFPSIPQSETVTAVVRAARLELPGVWRFVTATTGSQHSREGRRCDGERHVRQNSRFSLFRFAVLEGETRAQ